MKKLGCTVALIILAGCNSIHKPAEVVSLNKDICMQYDWSKVEQLVAPHLDDELHAVLVMNAQSANYNTFEAASMFFSDINDKNVRKILKRIIEAGCE